MVRILFILFLIISSLALVAQSSTGKFTKEDYILHYKDVAITEMNLYHIPASITLSQGILESASGNSNLARKANNHFGIKCHKGWTGPTFHMDDDAENECFRKYNDPYESFKDHSIFLSTRDRYAFLFELKITDYKGWANGLKKAGYATNPKYPELLIKIIEDYELYKYDKLYNKPVLASNKNEFSNQKGNKNGDDFKAIAIGAANREIFENNGVKFIYAKSGDTFWSIAQDLNIYTWQVYRYNDLKKNQQIREGQKLYLERKKNKGPVSYHTASAGESLHDISQQYGVKLNKICKYNSLRKDANLFPAQRIKLTK